ncbi:hypothetical protein D3C81_1669810 [compost metagenome]
MAAALATSGAFIAKRMPVTLGVVDTMRVGAAATQGPNSIRATAVSAAQTRKGFIDWLRSKGIKVRMIILLMQLIPSCRIHSANYRLAKDLR